MTSLNFLEQQLARVSHVCFLFFFTMSRASPFLLTLGFSPSPVREPHCAMLLFRHHLTLVPLSFFCVFFFSDPLCRRTSACSVSFPPSSVRPSVLPHRRRLPTRRPRRLQHSRQSLASGTLARLRSMHSWLGVTPTTSKQVSSLGDHHPLSFTLTREGVGI
jgi:hypothetical protein